MTREYRQWPLPSFCATPSKCIYTYIMFSLLSIPPGQACTVLSVLYMNIQVICVICIKAMYKVMVVRRTMDNWLF